MILYSASRDWTADLEQPDSQHDGAGAQHSWREADENDEAVKHQQIVRVLLSWNRDKCIDCEGLSHIISLTLITDKLTGKRLINSQQLNCSLGPSLYFHLSMYYTV